MNARTDPILFTQRLALVQGTFKASSLEGQSSDVVEANGKSFNIYVAHAAHAGAQRQRRVLLRSADNGYRINSCLRPLLLGCRVIRYKSSSAHPVQCAQTQRAYGCSGRRRPDARSEMTR